MFSFFDFRKEILVGKKSIYTFWYRNYIGGGGIANVYRGVDEKGNNVVIKVQDLLGMTEYNILKKLSHQNIVKVLDIVEKKEKSYMILEYVDGMILDTRHASNLANYCRQIVSALIYLTGEGIYHGDIKPQNIMVDKGDKIKIIDFNVSVLKEDINVRLPGTKYYMAPELFINGSYETTSDLWSLGITCGQILNIWDFLTPPLYQLEKVKKAKIDKKCKDFIKSLLKISPRERISWKMIQSHPFIWPLCFDKIEVSLLKIYTRKSIKGLVF